MRPYGCLRSSFRQDRHPLPSPHLAIGPPGRANSLHGRMAQRATRPPCGGSAGHHLGSQPWPRDGLRPRSLGDPAARALPAEHPLGHLRRCRDSLRRVGDPTPRDGGLQEHPAAPCPSRTGHRGQPVLQPRGGRSDCRDPGGDQQHPSRVGRRGGQHADHAAGSRPVATRHPEDSQPQTGRGFLLRAPDRATLLERAHLRAIRHADLHGAQRLRLRRRRRLLLRQGDEGSDPRGGGPALWHDPATEPLQSVSFPRGRAAQARHRPQPHGGGGVDHGGGGREGKGGTAATGRERGGKGRRVLHRGDS